MIELRWMVWENAGHQELQFRQMIDAPPGKHWSDWKAVPMVDATHPAATPAKG